MSVTFWVTIVIFQSTHPVRGGTLTAVFFGSQRGISIHPPREGWDALRCSVGSGSGSLFQSTHPVRGGTKTGEGLIFCQQIFQSTHPVRGGTIGIGRSGAMHQFQSTHPVRGGTRCLDLISGLGLISIHPPREGWDSKDAQNEPSSYEPLRQKRIRRSAFGKAKTLFL